MSKKRIVGLILSSFIAFGALMFSNAFNNKSVAKGDELVGTPTVGWNNVDYSSNLSEMWSPYTDENGVPQQGYCLLPLYPSNIANSSYTNENLLTANLPGCNVGDYILINGVASKNVEDVIIYCYPQNGFFLYVPHSSVAFSDTYEYVTVEVLEGMSIDGTYQTVATRFEYRGLLGSYGHWEVDPEPVEKIQGEFSKIDWNNVDYSYTIRQEWAGELGPNGAPVNGYCILVFFNEVGKSYSESAIGDTTIGGRGVIGIGLNVDYKVKVNGVNIVDVEDAICYIYPKYGLFFYLPHNSLTFNETYKYPIISIESGLHFNNVYLPAINFEFRGELGQPNCWTYTKDPSEYNHFDFRGVAEKWNNVAADASHNHTVLQFGEYGVDYLKNNQTSDSTNLINRYSDCGTKMTINGIPLWQIDDTTVSYIHGYCYLYFNLPASALYPSNGYKVVTFHIEENTIFYDTLLPEVNLYLFNGKWILERPETPLDSDYNNYLSFQDTFGSEKATLTMDSKVLSSTKDCSINSFKLFLDYKLMTSESAFALSIMGNDSHSGLVVVFRGNSVSLYDTTQGNALLGSASLELFSYDEWFSLLVYTRFESNKLSIMVAVDDITYIHADNVEPNNLGNRFVLNLESGEAAFKNASIGADNKKPVLSYTGKAVYSVLSGSDIIDFTNKCSAYDQHDGNVTKLIQYNWPEGAIINNKINKGIWEVKIVALDKSNNQSSMIVTVIAADKLDVIVTFDGKNPVNYRVGDHIACVPDPVKEGDSNTTYRFIGWYLNDRLWDFENDYVVADMNLVSRFQETAVEHFVSFTVINLASNHPATSFTLYFAHGTVLDLQIFAKDGLILKAYVNDEEVETITINQNMNVKLVYESTDQKPTKKGCGGDISALSSLLFVISGVGIIILISTKKKGGKEHE